MTASPHRIAILGSTGSIGCNALEVIEHLGPAYRVVGLSAHRNTAKLLEQTKHHRPSAIAITDPQAARQVPDSLSDASTDIYRGMDALVRLVQRDDVDTVLAAVVGSAGLPAVLAAVEAGKRLALANKESLVVAGSLLIDLARRKNVPILPVDSEHSAIFQAMQAGRMEEVRRVILTASGGPFRTASLEQIRHATVSDALNHPTWRMGSKITIDSATLFNKGLELIEACWLFNLPPERVEVVIHPESIVHSMVEFVDGSIVAQLSPPDMRTPIQYALTWPRRCEGLGRRMDWGQMTSLHFEPPDMQRFPALRLAYDVARRGGTAGAVMNAANEAAVEAFLAGRIAFYEISRIVEHIIAMHQVELVPTLDDLMKADRWARRTADELMKETPSEARGRARLEPAPSISE